MEGVLGGLFGRRPANLQPEEPDDLRPEGRIRVPEIKASVTEHRDHTTCFKPLPSQSLETQAESDTEHRDRTTCSKPLPATIVDPQRTPSPVGRGSPEASSTETTPDQKDKQGVMKQLRRAKQELLLREAALTSKEKLVEKKMLVMEQRKQTAKMALDSAAREIVEATELQQATLQTMQEKVEELQMRNNQLQNRNTHLEHQLIDTGGGPVRTGGATEEANISTENNHGNGNDKSTEGDLVIPLITCCVLANVSPAVGVEAAAWTNGCMHGEDMGC
ncbi:hypothetical protein CYMTET_27381, partial [Cymbomonas tetramitiformis]